MIASVSLTVIRRFYAHVRRYTSAYAQGKLSLAEIEWAMRKYTSHRRAKDPTADLDNQSLMPEWFCDMPAKGGEPVTVANQLGGNPFEKTPDFAFSCPQKFPCKIFLENSIRKRYF